MRTRRPTNHLDLHSVLWLQDYLCAWPGTVVVVSHAREFLNAVCTDIVHLQSRKLAVYKGDYNTFEGTRAELARTLNRQAEAASVRRAQVQQFIDKFRCAPTFRFRFQCFRINAPLQV